MRTPYLSFLLFLLIWSLQTNCQSVSVDYFEIYTKLAHPTPSKGFTFNKDSLVSRIGNIPDTTSMIATFVASFDDPTKVDSLFYTLTNSQGQSIYTGAIKVSGNVQLGPSYRQSGKTMYYSVGPYEYLKKFTASVKAKGVDGMFTPLKSFTKK